MGLLSDFVTSRLERPARGLAAPGRPGHPARDRADLRPARRGRPGTRFIALATHPDLREESDRVDAAEEALDDTVAVDDPRVAQVAAERHAFELALYAVIGAIRPAQDDDARFDAWDDLHPPGAGEADDGVGPGLRWGSGRRALFEAVRKMPYDFSPARLRCMELVQDP